MTPGMAPPKKFVASIEDASIMRKFTVVFLIMSLLPMGVLYYLYVQMTRTGTVYLDANELNLTLIFVVLGVLLGYFTMRKVLQDVIDLTTRNRKILEGVLTPEKMRELSSGKNEVAVLTQSFMAITERLEDNVRSLEVAKRTLHSIMTKIGHGIAHMENIDSFLDLILETITDSSGGTYGVLFVCDKSRHPLFVPKCVYGNSVDVTSEHSFSLVSSSPLSAVIAERKPRLVTIVPIEFIQIKAFAALKPPFICAPLAVKDEVNGIIIIGVTTTATELAADQESLLTNLSSQTAVAIENAKLNKDIEKTYFETISALALAVEAKDPYSRGHQERVAAYSELIGRKMGLTDVDVKKLRDAARLHDLGKIGIPDDVLRKPGPLTDQEWVLMRKHPEIGEGIIKPIASLFPLCDIVRHHHEKLNGEGYPDRISGDKISLLARIAAVADIYDALTTDRPYRKGMSIQQAGEVMLKMKDEIDQYIVERLISALAQGEHVSSTGV